MLALLSVAPFVCASKKIAKISGAMKVILKCMTLKTVLEWIQNYHSTVPSSGPSILALMALLPDDAVDDNQFSVSFSLKLFSDNMLLAKYRPNLFILVSFLKKYLDLCSYCLVLLYNPARAPVELELHFVILFPKASSLEVSK